jgi:hypothetical protein
MDQGAALRIWNLGPPSLDGIPRMSASQAREKITTSDLLAGHPSRLEIEMSDVETDEGGEARPSSREGLRRPSSHAHGGFCQVGDLSA